MDLVLRTRDPRHGGQLDADARVGFFQARSNITSPGSIQPDMSPSILDTKTEATEANLDSPLVKVFAAETRLKIYNAIFCDEEYTVHMMDSKTYRRLFDREKPDNVHVTSILQTCRQPRNEALPPFHPNVRVKLMHKEGFKAFLKLDTTLLDKSQLQHIIVACCKPHPCHITQIIDQLPKLRTFEVQCLEVAYVEKNHNRAFES